MNTSVPAFVGMRVEDVETPCLLVDLDVFEKNVDVMGEFAKSRGVALRAHAKTHRSADIALVQMRRGGAVGVCCQKVGEAEVLAAAGVGNVLVSNQVVDRPKIDRLAALARQARISVCVDDPGNIDDLATAAQRHGVTLECLVEIDVGGLRCGVEPGDDAVPLVARIVERPGLAFGGIQAYHGKAQHIRAFADRKAAMDAAIAKVEKTVAALTAAGFECPLVTGAGTGTYYFEAASGIYNELQCGSYVFMDADYQRIKDADGAFVGEFGNALFLYAQVMSKTKKGMAVCDAGLKSQSVDSGLPVVFGRTDVEYVGASDEHGTLSDPGDVLKLGDKLMLVPGHCDPTVNAHDWYVGVRGGIVECLWPVTARGRSL